MIATMYAFLEMGFLPLVYFLKETGFLKILIKLINLDKDK